LNREGYYEFLSIIIKISISCSCSLGVDKKHCNSPYSPRRKINAKKPTLCHQTGYNLEEWRAKLCLSPRYQWIYRKLFLEVIQEPWMQFFLFKCTFSRWSDNFQDLSILRNLLTWFCWYLCRKLYYRVQYRDDK